MMRVLLMLASIVAVTCNAAHQSMMSSHSLLSPVLIGVKRARATIGRQRTQQLSVPSTNIDITSHPNYVTTRGGGAAPVCKSGRPCTQMLSKLYAIGGIATSSAWATMCYTTIRDNQPAGALMPSWQHPVFARMGAMSAAALILGSFASLSITCSESNAQSWEDLGDSSPSFRRQNLALLTTGVASSLWVRFADVVTKIPGTNPVASHQCYNGIMQARLIGAYGAAAALCAAVWVQSLPEESRNPLTWPKRIGDGVSKAIVSIAPQDANDPVQVKYSLIASSMLIFTAMQTVCNMPIAVIPSWTSRRLSRAFPIYTFLGAVTAFDLKEATENGRILIDKNYRSLSNGVKGFGGLYLGARAGAVLLDPSFPEHFGMVNQVPGLAVAAALLVGLTLRSDKP